VKKSIVKRERRRGEVIEVLNRYEFLPDFIKSNFIPYVPEFDVGVDFILYREVIGNGETKPNQIDEELLLKVQAKGRWRVSSKYFGRDIWMAFPDKPHGEDRKWYFCPHDLMVAYVPTKTKGTTSWRLGAYGSRSFKTKKAKEFLRDFEMPAIISRLSKDYIKTLRKEFAEKW